MWGANPEQLLEVATLVGNAANAFESIRASVGSIFMSVEWNGMDANMSREIWFSKLSPKLEQCTAMLNEVEADLKRNAQQQITASDGSIDTSFFGAKLNQSLSGFSSLNISNDLLTFLQSFNSGQLVQDMMSNVGEVSSLEGLGSQLLSNVNDIKSLGDFLGPVGDVFSAYNLSIQGPEFWHSLETGGWDYTTIDSLGNSVSDVLAIAAPAIGLAAAAIFAAPVAVPVALGVTAVAVAIPIAIATVHSVSNAIVNSLSPQECLHIVNYVHGIPNALEHASSNLVSNFSKTVENVGNSAIQAVGSTYDALKNESGGLLKDIRLTSPLFN